MPDSYILTYQGGPGLRLSGEGPTARFRKEAIKDGWWVDGKHRFQVTPAIRDHWVRTFHRMRENGVRVTVPSGHAGAKDPDQQNGEVVDLFSEGDTLVSIMELSGEDAVRRAATNDVSLYSPASWTDGKGNEYVRPILHIAMCPNPVITGLGPFEKLVASKETTMDWTKIREALGIEDEVTDENANELVLAALAVMKKKVDDAETATTDAAKAAEDAKKVEASRTVDPLVLRLSTENREAKLDALVAAARLTPAARDKLHAAFIGKEGATLVLSLKAGDDGSTFDAVLAAVAENDPVALAEQTGQQTLALSNPTKSDENPLIADAKKRAERAKEA